VGRWRIVRGAAPPNAIAFLGHPARSAAPPEADILRQGNTRATLRVPGLGIVKLLHRVGSREKLAALGAPSVLAREYDLTEAAIARGVPAPRPILCAERRSLGLLREAAIVLEVIPDAASLQHLIETNFPAPGRRRRPHGDVRRALTSFGRALARLHGAGGVHGDPSPDNVLVTEDGRVVLIDWPFALFAGETTADRRALTRRAAKRYHTTPAHVAAALNGYGRDGFASDPFRTLCADDLMKAAAAQIQFGTPTREIRAFLRAYCRQLGFGRAEERQTIERVAAAYTPILRSSARRTIRNADRDSRRTASIRERRTVLCYRRGAPLDAVAEALETETPRFERRERDDAAGTWRNACALARFSLPARIHAACRFDGRSGRGTLLLERPAEPFEPITSPCPVRLAGFVRQLHAFGFRFVFCSDATLVEQPPSLGPFTFRQGYGYVLDDAGAVEYAPEKPTEASAGAVAGWLRGKGGAGAAAAFLERVNRRLRFHV